MPSPSSSGVGVQRLLRFPGPRCGPGSRAQLILGFIRRENLHHTDVEVFCEEGKFFLHRLVLASISPFLRSLLRPDDDSTHHLPSEVFLPGVRAGTFQVLLDFIYNGEALIDHANLGEVLSVGTALGLKGITPILPAMHCQGQKNGSGGDGQGAAGAKPSSTMDSPDVSSTIRRAAERNLIISESCVPAAPTIASSVRGSVVRGRADRSGRTGRGGTAFSGPKKKPEASTTKQHTRRMLVFNPVQQAAPVPVQSLQGIKRIQSAVVGLSEWRARAAMSKEQDKYKQRQQKAGSIDIEQAGQGNAASSGARPKLQSERSGSELRVPGEVPQAANAAQTLQRKDHNTGTMYSSPQHNKCLSPEGNPHPDSAPDSRSTSHATAQLQRSVIPQRPESVRQGPPILQLPHPQAPTQGPQNPQARRLSDLQVLHSVQRISTPQPANMTYQQHYQRHLQQQQPAQNRPAPLHSFPEGASTDTGIWMEPCHPIPAGRVGSEEHLNAPWPHPRQAGPSSSASRGGGGRSDRKRLYEKRSCCAECGKLFSQGGLKRHFKQVHGYTLPRDRVRSNATAAHVRRGGHPPASKEAQKRGERYKDLDNPDRAQSPQMPGVRHQSTAFQHERFPSSERARAVPVSGDMNLEGGGGREEGSFSPGFNPEECMEVYRQYEEFQKELQQQPPLAGSSASGDANNNSMGEVLKSGGGDGKGASLSLADARFVPECFNTVGGPGTRREQQMHTQQQHPQEAADPGGRDFELFFA